MPHKKHHRCNLFGKELLTQVYGNDKDWDRFRSGKQGVQAAYDCTETLEGMGDNPVVSVLIPGPTAPR